VKDLILKEPDKILRQVSTKVTDFKQAKKIADKLIEVIKSVDGKSKFWLGMAAPQIGISKRIFVLKKSPGRYLVVINPEIIDQKWNGPIFSRCFSVKGIFIRNCPYWTKIRYQDLEENFHTEVFIGGMSATLHQEIEHLDGILVSDMGLKIL